MIDEHRNIGPVERYIQCNVFADQYVENHNEILDYIEEIFVPNVDEILLKVINLYNITIERESCIIGRRGKYKNVYLVNDTFMEDYIYRFIGLRNTILEYCKIMDEYVDELFKPLDDGKYFLYKSSDCSIFRIIFYGDDEIIMSSSIKGYEFYVNIHVEEKYRDSIRSILESSYNYYYR